MKFVVGNWIHIRIQVTNFVSHWKTFLLGYVRFKSSKPTDNTYYGNNFTF
jgi:hypothetical protein